MASEGATIPSLEGDGDGWSRACALAIKRDRDRRRSADGRFPVSSTPENCHHRAMEANLFGIDPESFAVVKAPDVPNELHIEASSIEHLPTAPHRDALKWAWDQLDWASGAVSSKDRK